MKKSKRTKTLKKVLKGPDDEIISEKFPDIIEPKAGQTIVTFIKRLKKEQCLKGRVFHGKK